jgi:serine/threonine protein kinase
MEDKGRIGPHRIDAEIAHSSICTIYKAYEENLDRPILIKKLHPQMSREEDIRKRFEREAQVCARVKHENIVDIYSYNADPDATYLVMEFVQGQSLGDLISKRGRVEWQAALVMLSGVLKGLGHAHAKGVTHRDIKPDNLLVSDAGQVKITDFGLSTIADTSRMTMQGAIVGTLAYLPPEQVSGGTFDFRGDLFSVGATFYEALTGVSPFSGANFSETLKKILTYAPPPPSSLIAEIPPEFDQILARLLEKQPSKRYATAEQALEDVKRLAVQKGINIEAAAIQSVMESSNGSGRLSAATPLPPAAQPIAHSAQFAAILVAGLVVVLIFLFYPSAKRMLPGGGSVSSGFISSVQNSVTKAQEQRSQPPSASPTLPDSSLIRSPVISTAPAPNIAVLPKVQDKAIIQESQAAPKREPPPLPVSIASGHLKLTSRPWATVSIDNVSYGQTPLIAPVELAPGRHLIALTNPEFPVSFVENVEIKPDESTTVEVNLWKLVGVVQVMSVKPWAEIFVDGASYGTTPRAKPIILPFGKHIIELKNPAYKVWTQETVFDSKNLSLDIAVTLETK